MFPPPASRHHRGYVSPSETTKRLSGCYLKLMEANVTRIVEATLDIRARRVLNEVICVYLHGHVHYYVVCYGRHFFSLLLGFRLDPARGGDYLSTSFCSYAMFCSSDLT